jgi:hypothetical protein
MDLQGILCLYNSQARILKRLGERMNLKWVILIPKEGLRRFKEQMEAQYRAEAIGFRTGHGQGCSGSMY